MGNGNIKLLTSQTVCRPNLTLIRALWAALPNMPCKLRSRLILFFSNRSARLLVWFVCLNCQPVYLFGLYFCLPAWHFVRVSVCLPVSAFTRLPPLLVCVCQPLCTICVAFAALYVSLSFPNWENILNSVCYLYRDIYGKEVYTWAVYKSGNFEVQC